MTTYVAGVDGCRGGWFCVLRNLEDNTAQGFVLPSISEIFSLKEAPEVIAIDIPIGLPDRIKGSGRACDRLVRQSLGKRASSVFTVPARAAVNETDYRRACEVAALHSEPPRQISKQIFHLFPKIREVDAIMTPALQSRVRECHPETSFSIMNGHRPLTEPKKLRGRLHQPGFEMRLALLLAHGFSENFLGRNGFKRTVATPDDFLDACACAWSASRIANGDALCFPSDPPRDAKGLRMEIVV